MKSSKEIPVIARYLIPTVIFGNIGLCISRHLSLSASLLIYSQVDGEELIVDNLYAFSLGGITWDAWILILWGD